MDENKIKEAFTKIREKLKDKELPETLRGLKGKWLAISFAVIFCIILAVWLAHKGHGGWATAFAVVASVVLIGSNFWFRERVTSPIVGLGDTARRIADGSYGTLSERLRDDEIGELTNAINDMSLRIGEAGKTQSEFISSVSHELRTPLTVITGWSETLLYDESIQGDSRRGIDIISAESGRLTGMVEELLEFTRIRDGRFTLNLETVDLCELIEDVTFTYSELLRHDDIVLSYDHPDEGVSEVTGDPRRLKQVVLNILDNAVKYARGGRSIEVALTQDGEYVSIAVRDHGAGVAAEDLPHVKERFYKGRSKERGSGIGLAVCDEIVTRHGGKLIISNAEGGGAIITVKLPVKTQ